MTNTQPISYNIGNITILPETQELIYGRKRVSLRRKEFELLLFLIKNKNRVISRLTILEYVWDYSVTSNTYTVEVHMNQLRKKLRTINQRYLIETLPRLGYRLCEPATSSRRKAF